MQVGMAQLEPPADLLYAAAISSRALYLNDALHIRLATDSDMAALLALDTIAPHDLRRAQQLRHWVAARHCHLLLADAVPAAYGVLHHHFFDSGFIEMLMVGERFRRHGLGQALLQHLVARCERPRLFTSTNQSNQAMRALLTRNGFIDSGRIDNLDPGDPELVMFRPHAALVQPAM